MTVYAAGQTMVNGAPDHSWVGAITNLKARNSITVNFDFIIVALNRRTAQQGLIGQIITCYFYFYHEVPSFTKLLIESLELLAEELFETDGRSTRMETHTDMTMEGLGRPVESRF